MATQRNHQNNFATNLTSNQIAGVTTTPLNSIPSIAAPFSIALDATNINGKYEIVEVSSKTATNINHAATTYAHTTAEEVRMVVGADELDEFAAKTNAGDDGWISYSAVTPTYTSADDPTYTITFAAVDLTSTMSVGTRVKFTNNATTFYGIITAIAFSTNTVVTLYGGTDYDVANSAITAFYYSRMKAPLGFPLDPTKWTVQTTNTASTTQASPTQNVWYNINSINIIIPIGLWNAGYECSSRPIYTSNAPNQYTTLSTANNSESDSEFTSRLEIGGTAANLNALVSRYKILSLAAKTTYYLNHKTDNSTQTSLSVTSASPFPRTVVKVVCAYL